jgi:hypothetical protein
MYGRMDVWMAVWMNARMNNRFGICEVIYNVVQSVQSEISELLLGLRTSTLLYSYYFFQNLLSYLQAIDS